MQAQEWATQLGDSAQGVALDIRAAGFADLLSSLGVELVIHTAGPFQQQGHDVPLAVAQAGAHYIDLADGRRYVCDFAQAVGEAFQPAGRSAICWSLFPGRAGRRHW